MAKTKRYVAVVNISEIVTTSEQYKEEKTSEYKSALTVRANSADKLREKLTKAVEAMMLDEDDE